MLVKCVFIEPKELLNYKCSLQSHEVKIVKICIEEWQNYLEELISKMRFSQETHSSTARCMLSMTSPLNTTHRVEQISARTTNRFVAEFLNIIGPHKLMQDGETQLLQIGSLIFQEASKILSDRDSWCT